MPATLADLPNIANMDCVLPDLRHFPNPRLRTNHFPQGGEPGTVYEHPSRPVPIFVEPGQPIRMVEEFNEPQQRSLSDSTTMQCHAQETHVHEKHVNEKHNDMPIHLEFSQISNANFGQVYVNRISNTSATMNYGGRLCPILAHGLALVSIIGVSYMAWFLRSKTHSH
ncbi:hypothetical protein E0Z10_g1696 [Xylaria hypoxylon]|uniref:Uncharacterized protein n=1 Tax=Xylaria hypoxylon TaxID=37992 RepID=A0A4Z0Z6H2_9PEZI|nr:hypothetical protein E0Z10_g1696 [Xylaria hypoxylon]